MCCSVFSPLHACSLWSTGRDLWAALAGVLLWLLWSGFSLWLPSSLVSFEMFVIPLGLQSHSACTLLADSFQDDHKTPLDLMIFHRTSLISLGKGNSEHCCLLEPLSVPRETLMGAVPAAVASFPLDCCLDSALMAAGRGQVPCLLPKGWHT